MCLRLHGEDGRSQEYNPSRRLQAEKMNPSLIAAAFLFFLSISFAFAAIPGGRFVSLSLFFFSFWPCCMACGIDPKHITSRSI